MFTIAIVSLILGGAPRGDDGPVGLKLNVVEPKGAGVPGAKKVMVYRLDVRPKPGAKVPAKYHFWFEDAVTRKAPVDRYLAPVVHEPAEGYRATIRVVTPETPGDYLFRAKAVPVKAGEPTAEEKVETSTKVKIEAP